MQKQKHIVDIMFVVALFALYTVCILIISIIGINLYTRGVEISQENYSVRTSVLYLTEKTRQSNAVGSVSVRELFGNSALVLTQTIGERTYENWIYLEEGYLTEVLVVQGAQVAARTGQNIMPLAAMQLEIDENSMLLITTQSEDGNIFTSKVFLPTYESEAVQ